MYRYATSLVLVWCGACARPASSPQAPVSSHITASAPPVATIECDRRRSPRDCQVPLPKASARWATSGTAIAIDLDLPAGVTFGSPPSPAYFEPHAVRCSGEHPPHTPDPPDPPCTASPAVMLPGSTEYATRMTLTIPRSAAAPRAVLTVYYAYGNDQGGDYPFRALVTVSVPEATPR